VLTYATRGIDLLNLSLGCFDNEPDSHLVMAHLVEQLQFTSTTSGPSPTRTAQRQSPPGRCTAAGRAGQQWPGYATEPEAGVPAVPVVRPVAWYDVLVDDPAAAATTGARLPRPC